VIGDAGKLTGLYGTDVVLRHEVAVLRVGCQ
jgi:hypothetical protein